MYFLIALFPMLILDIDQSMIGGNFVHVDHPFSINGDSAVSNGRAHNGYSPGDIRAKPAERIP